MSERPGYDRYVDMELSRGPLAEQFASQVLLTARPWLSKPDDELAVLDAGCGYGATAIALSRRCRSVIGCEPAADLYRKAKHALSAEPHGDLGFINLAVEEIDYERRFDLVVLDNVYEHLSNQDGALRAIHRSLKPGGVLFLVTPNKLWPIEAHYRLPGLSWLPLRWADTYLRWSGRGESYKDASYAPTYWSLKASLARHDWAFEFVLPGDRTATLAGNPFHYRAGMALLERAPILWCVSKALLVVARKPDLRKG